MAAAKKLTPITKPSPVPTTGANVPSVDDRPSATGRLCDLSLLISRSSACGAKAFSLSVHSMDFEILQNVCAGVWRPTLGTIDNKGASLPFDLCTRSFIRQLYRSSFASALRLARSDAAERNTMEVAIRARFPSIVSTSSASSVSSAARSQSKVPKRRAAITPILTTAAPSKGKRKENKRMAMSVRSPRSLGFWSRDVSVNSRQ